MLRLNMLPAEYGDCLLLEYGHGKSIHRLLIDGGTPETGGCLRKAIEDLPEAQRHFDLVVMTHIDADHIGGMLKLLKDPPKGFGYDDFWFNGFQHLGSRDQLGGSEPAASLSAQAHWDLLGVAQAEELTKLVWPDADRWNQAFEGGAVVVPGPEDSLPVKPLEDGASLTLLSPTPEKLQALRKVWTSWLEERGKEPYTGDEAGPADREDRLGSSSDVQQLATSPFRADSAPNNGSSIAFLFEWNDRAILFGADAHPGVLQENIDRLCRERKKERLPLNALKLAHHGSKHNFDPECLTSLECSCFLVSTNGDKFNHPDDETIARIVTRVRKASFFFNYPQSRQARWKKWKAEAHPFEMHFPDGAEASGICIDF